MPPRISPKFHARPFDSMRTRAMSERADDGARDLRADARDRCAVHSRKGWEAGKVDARGRAFQLGGCA
jgi:hypothetical protein